MGGPAVNKVTLVGRLGRDPELRTTGSGKSVCSFSIATEDRSTKAAVWHNIVAWNKTAEICAQYLSKGSLVYVDGRLSYRDWVDRNDVKRTTAEIVAYDVQFISTGGGRRDDGYRDTGGGQGGGYRDDEEPIPF